MSGSVTGGWEDEKQGEIKKKQLQSVAQSSSDSVPDGN